MKKLAAFLIAVFLFGFTTPAAAASRYMVNPFYAIRSYTEYQKVGSLLGDSNHMYYGWGRLARDSGGKIAFTNKGANERISKYDIYTEYYLPDTVGGKLTNEIYKSTHPNSKNLLMVFFNRAQYDDGKISSEEFLNMSSADWDKNIIEPMMSMVNQYGFDGVALDFEGFINDPSGLKEKYNSFLGQLKMRLQGKQLVVCVHVPENFDGYDYGYIYNTADYVILLAYSYKHYSTYQDNDGVPGLTGKIKEIDIPEAQPLGKVQDSLKGFIDELRGKYKENFNPKKILLGTTLEINGWIEKEIVYNQKPYTYYEKVASLPAENKFNISTLDALDKLNGKVEYISVSNTYGYTSKTYRKVVTEGLDQGMKKIEYYYETPESIYDKCSSLVHEFDLAGVSVWRMGLGNNSIWSSMNNIFTTPSNGYSELPEKTDVPVSKMWTVKFNMPIDKVTMMSSRKNIAVVDSDGNPADIKLEYDTTSSSVKVTPVSSYKIGQVYYLIVGEDIKSDKGGNLGQPIRMKFKVK